MTTPYEPPEWRKDAFNCALCNAYSKQNWSDLIVTMGTGFVRRDGYHVSTCTRCNESSIWYDKRMVHPNVSGAPLPNPDMPDSIKKDYMEARDIVSRSPRGACALLRLCVENICTESEKSGDLNEKIKKLVVKGLDPQIQKALDSVRVIGGEAVHPLEMDLRDNVETAQKLFKIVNYISDWAHTRPKAIEGIFESLPDSKKEAIKKRDG